MTQLAEVLERSPQQLTASDTGDRPRAARAAADEDRGSVSLSGDERMASEFALLARRVFFAPDTEPRRLVAVAPADSSADTAAVSAGLARACARQSGGAVCIVDANWAGGAVAQTADDRPARGLSDALFGECSLGSAAAVVEGRLWSMSPGSLAADAAANMPAGDFVATVHSLKTKFDRLVVNLAGATMHRDLTILGPVVDGVVLVIDASATRRQTARRVLADLEAAHIDVLGAVLTNRTFPIPGAIYRRL
ncbi:MAG TPA: hypothetical protein VFX12_03695 [Vicinamibacterales bacterium]|nr:hypothetical protein [Vicinamibacterales bacterium]